MDGGADDNENMGRAGLLPALIGLTGWCTYKWPVLAGKGIMLNAGTIVAVFGLYLHYAGLINPSREPL
ncbi:hypothetical protein SAMN03159423_5158 [Bradyrhizobium sp. NFR13]|nr:hypothetical protein SAMN03159423_5158 [Bradyrhizobium sp. NFR13]